MKGHEPLLAMRRAGFTPESVWLNLDPDTTWRDWPQYGNKAQIAIEPSDPIRRLDLRCLVGLQVWVHGSDEARVQIAHEACIAAKAGRVMSAVFKPNSRGELTTVRMLDSAGKLEGTWPNT